MAGFLNTMKDSEFFQYQKSLNFDNWKLYIHKSNGKHINFFIFIGSLVASITSFKIINLETSEESTLNTNLLDITSTSIYFLNTNDLPALNKSVYYYEVEAQGEIYKSELFYNCEIESITEADNWLYSNSFLKIKQNSENWNFENSVNFDNKELYKNFSAGELPPFSFSITGFTEGNLVSFGLRNYTTNELINIGTSYITGSYLFAGLFDFAFDISNGNYYYEIVFDNATLKSEIFCFENFVYEDGNNYITDESGNYITDESGNKIKYV